VTTNLPKWHPDAPGADTPEARLWQFLQRVFRLLLGDMADIGQPPTPQLVEHLRRQSIQLSAWSLGVALLAVVAAVMGRSTTGIAVFVAAAFAVRAARTWHRSLLMRRRLQTDSETSKTEQKI
jgi:hypothetical protein